MSELGIRVNAEKTAISVRYICLHEGLPVDEKPSAMIPKSFSIFPGIFSKQQYGINMNKQSEDVSALQFRRQWQIFASLALYGFGRTLRELASEHGVSPLTIRRDFETLQAIFGPFRTTREAHGELRYFFDSQDFVLTETLDQKEILALLIAKKMMLPLENTSFGNDYSKACSKLFTHLPHELMNFAQNATDSFQLYLPGSSGVRYVTGALDRIFQGIVNRRVLSIGYRSLRSTKIKRYRIHP
ncbi:MAG: hypothetical protein Q4F84_10750, partial [Fibrobacter sp.]|nr:hypothetical protein [Fibrobacter sp.]